MTNPSNATFMDSMVGTLPVRFQQDAMADDLDALAEIFSANPTTTRYPPTHDRYPPAQPSTAFIPALPLSDNASNKFDARLERLEALTRQLVRIGLANNHAVRDIADHFQLQMSNASTPVVIPCPPSPLYDYNTSPVHHAWN